MSNELSSTLAQLGDSFGEFKSRFASRLEALELKLDTPSNPAANLKGAGPKDREHLKHFESWLRRPKSPDACQTLSNFEDQELRGKAASIGTPSSGGFAVPEILAGEVQRRIRDLSPLAAMVRRFTAASGDFRLIVDIGRDTAGWVGESVSGSGNRAATDTPVLANVAPTFGMSYCRMIASEELAQDSAFSIAAWLIEAAVERLAIAEEVAIISGTGSNQPTGILNTNPVSTGDSDSPPRAHGVLEYVPTGAAGAFVNDQLGSPPGSPADVLIDLLYRLRSGYRQSSAWAMNSETAATVAKFKDREGNYLLRPSMIAGQPDMLLGRPVLLSEALPGIGSNTHPIILADWRRLYALVDVGGLRITTDEISTPGQVRFYVRRRLGGAVMDDHAGKALKASET